MRNLRSQKEIMASWKGDLDTPVVSICCITYNHELFIEDALEGFLIQNTNFPIEILIHDDASKDRTANIIRKYERLYPRIIKPIYQTENQYQKGKKINIEFNFPRAQGELIALCEGDDYWLDTNKIQTQADIHRRFMNISLSCHKALEKNLSKSTENMVFKLNGGDQFLKSEDIITKKNGYVPTASMMITTKYLWELIDFFKSVNPPVGDYFIQMFMAFHDDVYYVSSLTSIYRKNVPGSWSENQLQKEMQIKHRLDMIDALQLTSTYFKSNSKVNYIVSPWAHNAVCVAQQSQSLFTKLVVIASLSPKLRVTSIRLFLKYYYCIFRKAFKNLKA